MSISRILWFHLYLRLIRAGSKRISQDLAASRDIYIDLFVATVRLRQTPRANHERSDRFEQYILVQLQVLSIKIAHHFIKSWGIEFNSAHFFNNKESAKSFLQNATEMITAGDSVAMSPLYGLSVSYLNFKHVNNPKGIASPITVETFLKQQISRDLNNTLKVFSFIHPACEGLLPTIAHFLCYIDQCFSIFSKIWA